LVLKLFSFARGQIYDRLFSEDIPPLSETSDPPLPYDEVRALMFQVFMGRVFFKVPGGGE